MFPKNQKGAAKKPVAVAVNGFHFGIPFDRQDVYNFWPGGSQGSTQGISMVYTFNNATAEEKKAAQRLDGFYPNPAPELPGCPPSHS